MMRTVLLSLCLGLAIAPISAHADWRGGGGSLSGDAAYHTIIDHTQANHINAIVTNTQSTTSARSFPYTGSNVTPYAAINPNLYPAGYAKPNPDLYVQVLLNNSSIKSSSLTAADNYTCDQGDPAKCPNASPPVPTTFVHRLGNYSSSTGAVTPLTNPKLVGGAETLNNMFTLNDQAFDMDRLRYVANRLWYQWKQDKTQNTGWATRFSYQPTGTMSFENFVYNIVHKHPMFGVIRVVIPTSSSGDMFLDKNQPVAGAEFSTTHTWSGTGTGSSSPSLYRYEAMIDSTVTSSAHSGTMTVYGMILIDYVDKSTYDPNDFFDASQDYIDRYASTAAHDSAATSSLRKNVILPRSSGRNIVLMDWDTLNINPVDDLQSFVQYTDPHTAGPDGRMDTLDIARRKYMMAKSVAYASSDVSDAYVWEYWMRKAAALPATDATRAAILTDLTGSASQYNVSTQAFASGATRRTDFDTTEWANMAEQDKFHAFFPNGYERGWMIAFDALRMGDLDATTAERTAGSWWMHLPDDVAGVDGGSMHTGRNGVPYPEFEVPVDTQAITVDADGDGTATKMPNFFSTDWEDLPALAFAGGLLDVHGDMNASGMLYTPDSCEIEAHKGSEVPGGSTSAGPFQYVSGAILAGNGIWLEDQYTSDHSMIALSYNYNAFDRLRAAIPIVEIKKAQNVTDIAGQ